MTLLSPRRAGRGDRTVRDLLAASGQPDGIRIDGEMLAVPAGHSDHGAVLSLGRGANPRYAPCRELASGQGQGARLLVESAASGPTCSPACARGPLRVNWEAPH